MYTTYEGFNYLVMKQLKVDAELRQEVDIRDMIPGIPLSRCRKSGTGPGLIMKFGTETGSHNQQIWDGDWESKF